MAQSVFMEVKLRHKLLHTQASEESRIVVTSSRRAVMHDNSARALIVMPSVWPDRLTYHSATANELNQIIRFMLPPYSTILFSQPMSRLTSRKAGIYGHRTLYTMGHHESES